MALLFKAMAVSAGVAVVSADQGPSGGSMQKCISMLTDMQAKVKTEKNDEEIAFTKFKTWCAHEDVALNKDIKQDGEDIDMLTADIADLGDQITGLGDKIAQLESDIEKYTGNLKDKVKQRKTDNEEFLAEQKDYSDSIDAVARALETVSGENYDRTAGAAALLQLSNKNRMPAKVRSIMEAFIGLEAGTDDASPPEANAYEFQSGGIVDMLKKLADDFRGKLGEIEKAEANSLHAFNMVQQDLVDSTAFAKKDISERTKLKQQKTEQKAADEKQLAATINTKAASENTLKEVTTECMEKGLSFDEKQQLRAEEIEAISKAVEILGSDDVAGQHGKHLQLAQEQAGVASFAQLRATIKESPRLAVRRFIAAESNRLKSKGLALLAQKMTMTAGAPFDKVKKMIDGMITRLLEEANADASHEGFCDAEIGKSKITRTKLQEDIDALGAAVDEGKATILHLTNKVAELSKQVSDIDAAVNEASELRQGPEGYGGEKAANAQTVKEAKLAQEKVQAATAVLKDFYAKAGGATGFVQTAASSGAMGVPMGSEQWNSLANPGYKTVDLGHKEGMQTFGKKYTGNQDAAGGVFALLEVILSDFANLEADTVAAEDAAQRAFEEFVTVSNKDKAVANKQIEMDTADKVAAEARLQEDTADWKATQDELLAAERYYDKLVPQCFDPGQSFEERTAARESEIESLKEALTILGTEDIETSA